MAKPMNDEERAQALKDYNPKDHLIPVGKDRQGKITLYYPAAWRLYELHLRYPNANFRSEILYQDEKGAVIVKAYLYLGKNYEESDKKAEAMKQGNMTTLDKVETAAKARCARDFGIGTEYALDMEPDETDATHDDTPSTSSSSSKDKDERKAPLPPSSSSSTPSAPAPAHNKSKASVTPAVPTAPPEPIKLATSEQLEQITAICEQSIGVYEWKHFISQLLLPKDTSTWTEAQAHSLITSATGWSGSPRQQEWLSKPATPEQKETIKAYRQPEHYGEVAVAALKSRIPTIKDVVSTNFTREHADLLLRPLQDAQETVARAKGSDPQFALCKALGVTHPLDFYCPVDPLDEGLEKYLTKLAEREQARANKVA